MIKYETLLNVLDELRKEAPQEFSSYFPDENDHEKMIQARSKAFIHLFLKVRCGLLRFRDRHNHITEGGQDGGIDAYYIDAENKKLYLIQSKFRSNPDNFEEKSITADELIKMEITRILQGHEKDSYGNQFNDKVKAFQEKWRQIGDKANYKQVVIILANLTRYNEEQIVRLIDHPVYEVYDYARTYSELIFPLCAGTYYDPNEIKITIHLDDEKEPSTLRRNIQTSHGAFQVRIVFVPAKEIGRILSKYKNAILKFNPRNYLSLSKNKVNKKIRDSIVNVNTNDFAIFNNGITLTAASFRATESTGIVNVGQIILTNPQIINGGQTAYTLSKIYDLHKEKIEQIFGHKEVMLKVIILRPDQDINLDFIEEVSNATNQQSKVEEADRRSNEAVQIKIQKCIYDEFGYLYERKRGEFYNALDNNYISTDKIIDRTDFLRAYYAFKGAPRWARQKGAETLFKERSFSEIIDSAENYKKMFFSYMLLMNLYQTECDDPTGWGSGLRYGKMAIISAVAINCNLPLLTKDEILQEVNDKIRLIKNKWLGFEEWVKAVPANAIYMQDSFDFDNYYKGITINQDVVTYFNT